jgi:hypothetical protein
MPAFLKNLIIAFAIDFGLGELFKRFPWLPPGIRPILEWLLEKLKAAKTTGEKKALKQLAKQKVKEVCYGANCKTRIKEP